jgi:hypothetical protein
MKTLLPLLFCLLLLGNTAHSQEKGDSYKWQKVLKRGWVDKQFVFGKWSQNSNETRLKYLGTVKAQSGKTYKIMNSVWIWGLAHRATSDILIFDQNNKYMGNYYVTMTYDLPDKLVHGVLVFTNLNKPDCNRKLTTRIDLRKGLPKTFFLECEGGTGDLYSFATAEE